MPIKALAVILTLALTSVMAWGFSKLKVGYDPDWYLPSTRLDDQLFVYSIFRWD